MLLHCLTARLRPGRMAAEQALPGAKVPWGATALPWPDAMHSMSLMKDSLLPQLIQILNDRGVCSLIDSAASWGVSVKMAAIAQVKMLAMAYAKAIAMAWVRNVAMA